MITGFIRMLAPLLYEMFISVVASNTSFERLRDEGILFKTFLFAVEAIDVMFQQNNRPSRNMTGEKRYSLGKLKLYWFILIVSALLPRRLHYVLLKFVSTRSKLEIRRLLILFRACSKLSFLANFLWGDFLTICSRIIEQKLHFWLGSSWFVCKIIILDYFIIIIIKYNLHNNDKWLINYHYSIKRIQIACVTFL